MKNLTKKVASIALAVTSALSFNAITASISLAHQSREYHSHDASGRPCYYYKTRARAITVTNRTSKTVRFYSLGRLYTLPAWQTTKLWVGGGTTTCNQRPYSSPIVYDGSYKNGFQHVKAGTAYAGNTYIFVPGKNGVRLH